MSVITNSALAALLTFAVAVPFARADYDKYCHYGDCGGRGVMPAEKDRPALYDGADGRYNPQAYVYAHGRIACPNGEKLTGTVSIWQQTGPDTDVGGDVGGGLCGPRSVIILGYFEVDAVVGAPTYEGMGALPKPLLWFQGECEGRGPFTRKICLKCPTLRQGNAEPDFNVMVNEEDLKNKEFGVWKKDLVCPQCK